MNIKEVKDLIREILQSDISEFELEHTGTKLKLTRGVALPPQAVVPPPAQSSDRVPESAAEAPRAAAPPAAPADDAEDESLHYITSPIVGTFYRAPSPGAEPFIKVGQAVGEGTVLCIVEAMKIMNEIPSDVTGEVVEILVDNSQPVEFGQKLFGIKTHR
jgi:acetyl-CoA carboxylase biotin carboxyl carrier protein